MSHMISTDEVGDKNSSTTLIEEFGVQPIPLSHRNMGPGMLFLIWALTSAGATTPIIGLLLNDISLSDYLYLMVASGLIGIIPAALLAHMGRQVPVISMVMARQTWGFRFADMLTFVFSIAGAGWFGLNTDIGGQILNALFPLNVLTWDLVLGVAQTSLVVFGMEVLEKFYKYTSLIFLSSYSILVFYLFSHYKFILPDYTGRIPWGYDIDLILSFGLLAWAYDFPTVTRFCVPIENSFSAGTVAIRPR